MKPAFKGMAWTAIYFLKVFLKTTALKLRNSPFYMEQHKTCADKCGPSVEKPQLSTDYMLILRTSGQSFILNII